VRALISTWDKTGLDVLARGLAELGWELVASGGTSAYLEELGLEVTRVESLTDVPELLGGRVKTLHPRIHAGILARRDRDDDIATLEEHAIAPFDLVCVNLYPFEQATARRGVTEADAVELIDVGGPSLLRGAAKNFAHVTPICRPEQYERVLLELREAGAVSLETRRRLAADAFATTAAYDAAIAAWFAEVEEFPTRLTLAFTKELDLAYGENPHQQAAFYRENAARRHLLSRVEQLHGRDLSFNNLNDLAGAVRLLHEFALPACVIVKHANPCGVAVGASALAAYERALAGDPTSAYGGVVACNRPVDEELGERLAEQFVEVLIAPGYAQRGLAALRRKPATRILVDRERRGWTAGELDLKRVPGGLLVQHGDSGVGERASMEVVCGSPSEAQWGDLLFAWRVCKHVSSNAIVLAKELGTVGIGAGQMSRVDAVRIAVEKAGAHGHDLAGAAMASDAFFPFPDGPRLALAAGVTSVIQPGGSKRDADVVAAVEGAGAAMVFTGRRHFRH
jgi:phosphoribosylaminoimidazolecarboxamide formyltransferase/IMP cyclohydrolase